MSHAESEPVSAEVLYEPDKTGVLSEAEFAELVYRHRAKILTVSGELKRVRHQVILMLDGGGSWVLDGTPKLSRLVGKRVTVEGTRFDFNGINVNRFKTEGADWPTDGWWKRLARWLAE